MRDQKQADAEHLRLLAIFHFVGAGLAFLALLFLCAHFALMHVILSNPAAWKSRNAGMPPPQLFAIFKVIYLLGALWFLASATLNVLSGLFLLRRRNRTFSLVVAGMNCLHLPLGTVLGVITLVVLLRDSVREAYATPPVAAP
jgi:hypothetical protein